VDATRLPALLVGRPPGTEVRATLFRRDVLIEVPVTLGEPKAETASIVPIDGASSAQTALREAWLDPFRR
jgi:predicted metalloprotease with PDZ domain